MSVTVEQTAVVEQTDIAGPRRSSLMPPAAQECPELPGVRAAGPCPPGEGSPRAAFQYLLGGRAVLYDASGLDSAVGELQRISWGADGTSARVHVHVVLGRDDVHGRHVAGLIQQLAGAAERATVTAVRGGRPSWLEHGMPDPGGPG